MSGNQMILLGGNPQQAAVDPYFYSVTSLLHGDGTNGGQNNTFLDSSSNNFTITRNGNTTQGSFSPFSQTGWSNYFDGTGDYLTTNATQAIPATGDFTVDGWIWCNSYANGPSIISQGTAGTSGRTVIYITTAGKLALQITSTINEFGSAIPTNQWVYFAITRTGSTVTAYINGSSVGTATNSGSIQNTTLTIGGEWNGDPYRWIGYLSNIRVSNIVRTITAAPTAPFTSDANTVVLTCQANRFLDASTNNFTITRNGDVSVQPFSPFNPTTAYSTSAVGGSGYFDGSGDYLSLADNAAFDVGSGNFTFEFWMYTSVTGSDMYIFGQSNSMGSTATVSYYLYKTSGNKLTLGITNGVSLYAATSTNNLPVNAWVHIACVRDGNTLRNYINGVQDGTADVTGVTAVNSSTQLAIGRLGEYNASLYSGYISNFRMVVGTCVYTGGTSFTPPTAPLPAIANTQLLCNFTNGAIFDNAAVADYETVGNAQISTSVKKYGTGSLAFDGTGDWLLTKATTPFDLGTGDMTFECWFYITNTIADYRMLASDATNGNNYICLRGGGTGGQIEVNVNGTSFRFNLSNTVSQNTWTHLAVVRIGSTWIAYINGLSLGTNTSSGSFNLGNGGMYVGRFGGATAYEWPGYIDDLRISKGIARYPYNFTPPTAEFPNIGGTVTLTADPYYDYTTLLLPGNGTNGAQNNTFLDSSTNAFSITRNGNTTQGTFSPFSQTGWGNYFDGSGDYLSLADNAAFQYGTGDFTIEFWFYMSATAGSGNYYVLYDGRPSGTSGAYVNIAINNATPESYVSGSTVITGSALSANTWYHFAYARSGTSTKMFVNGTQVGSTYTDTTNYVNGTARPVIGTNGFSVGTSNFNGYFSNYRVVKGTAVYTANFTPPTSPLTAITNTSLLTCQSNRFIDNSTNNFTITRNGDVSVQAFSPFNPTAVWSAATYGGSGYFDGSGDYLNTTSTQVIPSGSFTVEAWVYLTTTSTAVTVVAQGTSGNGARFSLGIEGGLWWTQIGGATINAGTPVTNTWTHLAVTFNGSTLTLYVNGTSVGTASTSTNAQNTTLRIGSLGPVDWSTYYWPGYIGQVRISNTVRSISVPTALYTADANTTFLANFTNAGIYDATSKNDLETVGNAQISTTQSKFGGSSMYFDGTGDYLVAVPMSPLSLGGGDYTVECWVYLNSSKNQGVWDSRATNTSTTGVALYITSGNVWRMVVNNATFSVGGTITNSTWTHVAVVRFGSTITVYVNGSSVNTTTSSNNLTDTTFVVGTLRDNVDTSATFKLDGYINDLRITKGIARYTSNFTPPTTAFLTL